VTEPMRLEPLSWSALFALLLAMFAITVGYGIVLPILPFLIERLASTTDAMTLSWHTGLLTGSLPSFCSRRSGAWFRTGGGGGRPVL